ncbi:hypothetical protein AB0M02_04910 [Actinoplanes sp. NPDC051861]|uniref:hypothetical protein n=1 Tax=Actinoplanes sp. NPDC051861 TaxID=3155170 RepID=UPI0034315F7D
MSEEPPESAAPQPEPPEPEAPEEDTAERSSDQPSTEEPARPAGRQSPKTAEGGGPEEKKDESWTNRAGDAEGAGPQDTFTTSIHSGNGVIVGDNANMIVIKMPDGRQVAVLRYQRTAAWLAEAERTFVQAEEFDDFVVRLRRERVIYLCGRPGTGRRFLAERLVAKAVTAGRGVHGVHVPDKGVPLADLARKDDLIVPDAGVVLEVAENGPVTLGVLDALAAMATSARSYLVILGEARGPGGAALGHYEIQSEPPDPEAVLDRHLTYHLRRGCVGSCADCTGSCRREFVERCLALEEVRNQLTSDGRPATVADLARVLAAWDGVDGTLKIKLNSMRERVRAVAFELVNGGDKAEPDPVAAPRRQAVQIAYAAFAGYPLADVFEVAELLFQVLWAAQYGEKAQDRTIFDGGVEQILRVPHGMDLLHVDPAEHPRRVWFTDARLPFDVLDVAWHDFDQVRGPVQDWLDHLVKNARPGIRGRAASVAGWLATYDFDEVWRRLIRPWATAGSGTLREAAAQALDTAVEEPALDGLTRDPRLVGLIRSRVRDWARSASAHMHDTAARAYGTRLGTLALREALDDLYLLAGRDDLNGSASIARSLQSLYLDSPAEIRAELLRWMRDDKYRIQVHAARSLVLIAGLASPPPRHNWPLLLSDLERAGEDPQLLSEPWRAALAGPSTSLRAWATLHVWLLRADADPEVQDRVLALGREIVAAPLDGRARFALRQWARECDSARLLLKSL